MRCEQVSVTHDGVMDSSKIIGGEFGYSLWGLTFSAQESIFGLVLKKNDYVVKSMRNLDVKCEVQMCL